MRTGLFWFDFTLPSRSVTPTNAFPSLLSPTRHRFLWGQSKPLTGSLHTSLPGAREDSGCGSGGSSIYPGLLHVRL